jgi:peptidoglycan/LPS O-acetylase OafA/YrhL
MLNNSNIVLEINNIKMKNIIGLAILLVLVLFSVILWLGKESLGLEELSSLGVILALVGFAVFILIRRIKSWKSGEPQEDELSKKVMLRTSSLSYYVSLYFWVFLLWLKDRVAFEQEELLGTGILGMALIFALSWVYYHFRGVPND